MPATKRRTAAPRAPATRTRTTATAARPRTPRPPTAAQLAAREQRERERQARAAQRERAQWERSQQRQLDAYHKALAAKAAREKREQIAREKKQLREQERRIRQELQRHNLSARDFAASDRAEYARLAKDKPYERFKYRGHPSPVLGSHPTTYTLAPGERAAKIAGRIPKADDPRLVRDRIARNELRVRELRGRVHDLEIDVRHAEYAYKALRPGTKTYETKRAAYKRALAAYDRAVEAWQRAYQKALADAGGRRQPSARSRSGAAATTRPLRRVS